MTRTRGFRFVSNVILLCILLFCAYIWEHELKVLFALDILKKRFQ